MIVFPLVDDEENWEDEKNCLELRDFLTDRLQFPVTSHFVCELSIVDHLSSPQLSASFTVWFFSLTHCQTRTKIRNGIREAVKRSVNVLLDSIGV